MPVRVADLDDPLIAERDENEQREAFTPSERVEMARVIEERIGNRQGQRTDKKIEHEELPGIRPEVKKGEETRDVAAKQAGFASSKSFRQAAKVVEKGTCVLSLNLNLHRRHLSVSQLSMIGGRAREVYDAQAKERQKCGKGGKLLPANLPEAIRGEARDLVGKIVGVSGLSIDSATKVLRSATPEVVQAVDEGRQLGRRNLTRDVFMVLLGRRYNRTKRQGARTDLTLGNSYPKLRSSEKLAAEHGCSEKQVRLAGKAADFVERK